jgi:hypothetical protein
VARRRRRKSSPFSLFAFQDIITSVTGILLLLTLLLTLSLILREYQTPAVQTRRVVKQLDTVLADTNVEIKQFQQLLEERSKVVQDLAKLSPTRVRREVNVLEVQLAQLDLELQTLDQQTKETEKAEDEWRTRQISSEQSRRILAQLDAELKKVTEELEQLRSSNRLIYNPQQSSGKTAWLVEVDEDSFRVARVGVSAKPLSFDSVAALSRWCESRDPSAEYFVLLVRPQGIEQFQVLMENLESQPFDLGFDLIGEDQTVIDLQTGAAAKL